MSVDEVNIETLSRAIQRDARDDAQQIQAEAQAQAGEIRQRAREQAEAERNSILERAAQEAERLRRQATATAELKARTLQLEQREKLLDKVFDAARGRLASIQSRPDYAQVAARLVREALAQLALTRVTVRADAATRKALEGKDLGQVAREAGAQAEFGDPLEDRIGVIVESADGRVQYDNTFETRLERMQGALRSSVYQVLMGERL